MAPLDAHFLKACCAVCCEAGEVVREDAAGELVEP
jgi:hypothetical protein